MRGGVGRTLLPLLPLLVPHRRRLALAAALGALREAALAGGAVLSAFLVGRVVAGRGEGVPEGLLVLVGVVVAGGAAGWIKMWCEYDAAYRILAELRGHLYDAFARLAPVGLAGRHSGELASTALADVSRVDWLFARLLPSLVNALLVPVAALVGLLLLCPPAALAMLPFLAALLVAPLALRRWAERQGEDLAAAWSEIHVQVLDGVRGLPDLLAYGAGEAFLDHLDRRSRLLAKAQRRFGLRAGLEGAATMVLSSGGMVVVLGVSAAAVTDGGLAPAWLPVMPVLATAGFGPVIAAANAAGRLGLVTASARRIGRLLEAPDPICDAALEGVPDPPGAELRTPSPAPPELRFESVRYHHPGATEPALDGADFQVPAGGLVVLAGHSGSGKSTCLQLTLRLADPQEGRVLLDGRDLRRLPLEALRRRVSAVLQEVHLFQDTISGNLRLGWPEAPPPVVEASLRDSGVAAVVAALPEGLESRVGEAGLSLSGGERQRLALARALVPQPSLLVLDEVSSDLDGESEALLVRTLARLRGRCTILMVSHSPSLWRVADRVVVLEAGRVVDEGAPEALLSPGRSLARLGGGSVRAAGGGGR